MSTRDAPISAADPPGTRSTPFTHPGLMVPARGAALVLAWGLIMLFGFAFWRYYRLLGRLDPGVLGLVWTPATLRTTLDRAGMSPQVYAATFATTAIVPALIY